MPINDVNSMKVADLKRELKVRGLSITGNKNELQERLQAAMEGEPLLEDGSLAGEDILDEEEGVLSDEEKILGSDENELLKSPCSTLKPALAKTVDGDNKEVAAIEDDILESPTSVAKKIVLKRKSSFSSSPSANINSSTAKENTEPATKAVKMSERNPITMGEDKKVENEAGTTATKKLKELTMQERLELRAKKFGLETKSTPAAAATSKEKTTAISMAPVVSSEKQVELLKKRAERFGCVTSTNLAKLDAEERLLKRKQRFGGEADATTKNKVALSNNGVSTVATKSTDNPGSDEWAEKARKRLERFKGNATPAATVDTPVVVPSIPAATNSA